MTDAWQLQMNCDSRYGGEALDWASSAKKSGKILVQEGSPVLSYLGVDQGSILSTAFHTKSQRGGHVSAMYGSSLLESQNTIS